MIISRVDPDFWRGRRVLLSGHTGFKGSWLAIWLARMGAVVTGISLPPDTTPSLFDLAAVHGLVRNHFVDIRDSEAVWEVVDTSKPEVVLHLAAQSLVRRGYAIPLETFSANLMGTVCLMEAIRQSASVRVGVMVTTDKVYANREWPWPYRENDSLGGHDPYSASKAASEIAIHAYRRSFFDALGIKIASARAGNVIGGGDWSEDRLIPDAVTAWSKKSALEVRRPESIRPWQHVLEPLSAYLVLAQSLWHGQAQDDAYNFGPDTGDSVAVRRILSIAQQCWGEDAKIAWGDGDSGPHESAVLRLDISRSKALLGISPRWNLRTSVQRTMDWYQKCLRGESALDLCNADIAAFEAAA